MEKNTQNVERTNQSQASANTQSEERGSAVLSPPSYNIDNGGPPVIQRRVNITDRKREFYGEIATQLIQGLMTSGVSQEKAFFVVAQVLQENGWSTEAPPGNNYFNIKGSYNGNSVSLTTHEEDGAGNRTQIQDDFRAYESLSESMADYLALLQNNFPDAYDALYNPEKGITDFVDGLANGKFGRYATDADYSTQVTTLANQVGREFGLAVPDFQFQAPVTEQNVEQANQGANSNQNTSEIRLATMLLKRAMGGNWDGTDEEAIYMILGSLNGDAEKIEAVKTMYQELYGISLVDNLKSELSDSWLWGNQLTRALNLLGASSTNSGTTGDTPSTQPTSEPARDKLSRVDFASGGNSRVQNRWVDDGENTQHADAFNEEIENKIVEFFGEGYTRERVLQEIQEAREAGDAVKAEELRRKLFQANMYSVVDALDVENNRIHRPGDGKTYCNIYAYDVVTAMGAYLPRIWWNSEYEQDAIQAYENGQSFSPDEQLNYVTGGAESDNNVREMNANSINQWLPRIGEPYFGWEKASSMQAGQQAANAGNIVIISAANTNSRRSGHINVILPETEQYKSEGEGAGFRPLQSQAGSSNFAHQAHSSQWWKNSSHKNGAAWIYKGELNSPLMTPEQMGGQNTNTPTPDIDIGENGNTGDQGTTPTAINKRGVVTASALNIRPQPNTSQARIGTLANSDVVTLVSEQDGWYQLAQGGWVSGSYLDVTDIVNNEDPQGGGTPVDVYGTVTAQGLNVRPEPNTNGTPLMVLEHNQTVHLVAEKDGWYKLQSGGWASGGFLNISNTPGGGGGQGEDRSTIPDTGNGGSVPERGGYNLNNAIEHLNSHAQARSTGYCARYVRQALEAGGLSTSGRPGSAKGYVSFLPTLGFTNVSVENYQRGDIVVFEAVTGHVHGHIAMYNGTQWVSDFKQNSIFVSNAYRNGVYHIFRWQ